MAASSTESSSSSALVCNPQQHALHFALTTDVHSLTDNSWTIEHASFGVGGEVGNSGLYIAGGSAGSGQLGYGAVVPQYACADVSSGATGHGDADRSTITPGRRVVVESCYDAEVYDANGDGLSSPHSADGGTPGGFALDVDGATVLEHRAGAACTPGDDECASEFGFEYCGARVCTVKYDGTAFAGTAGGVDTYTVSTLGGSQCDLVQPQCEGEGSGSSPSLMPLRIGVKTDSYADEFSWEVRISSRGDPKTMADTIDDNALLLAGGGPVYKSGSSNEVLLGQLGVGPPLMDNDEYRSTACVPKNIGDGRCYDFRAYDAYGDGLGCGASGSISIRLGRDVNLVQRDRDMAKVQDVDGTSKLACMDRARLSRWSLCAVRVCADGEVIGLEGNQCNFGMGEDLIDARYKGTDPLGDGDADAGGTGITPQLGGDDVVGERIPPPSFGGLLDFDPNLDGATVLNSDPSVEVAIEQKEEEGGDEESWSLLDFDPDVEGAMVLGFDPTFDEPEEGPAAHTKGNEPSDVLDFDPNVDGAMVVGFDPTFDEPEEGPAAHTKGNEPSDVLDFDPNVDGALVLGFDPNFDIVETRDEVVEEEQYDTWAQYYEALDPGFRDDDPGTETKESDIPLPAWAQLDDEEGPSGDVMGQEGPMPNSAEIVDKPEVMPDQEQEDQEVPRKPKDQEQAVSDGLDNESESKPPHSKSSKKPPVESEEEEKDDKNKGGPRAKSKKVSPEEPEENVMGYVSGSLNGNGDSPDVIHNGDVYVFINDEEDHKNLMEPRVDESKEERKEGKSERGQSGGKSKKKKREVEPEENAMGYVSGSNTDSEVVRNIRNGDIYVWIDEDQGEPREKRRKEGQKIRRANSTKKNKNSNKNESRTGPEENVMGYVSGSLNENSASSDGYDIIDGNIHVYVVGNRDDDEGNRGRNRGKRSKSEKKETRGKRSKSEKKETRVQGQERSNPRSERHGGQELNAMGYVSGSQNDNKSDDSEKGYEIINGNIHTTIRMVGNRGGRHRRTLRNTYDRYLFR